MFQEIAVARQLAKLKMEPEVGIEHVAGTLVPQSLPHSVKRIFDWAYICGMLGDQACCQPFESGTQFKNLQHVLFAQVHHSRAPSGCFGDEPILGEKVDGLANRSLSDAELARPGALHNSGARTQSAACDFFAQTIRHGVLHQRLCGGSRWKRQGHGFHEIASNLTRRTKHQSTHLSAQEWESGSRRP